jgi:UDP-N-acetylmuramoyl-L-alanyl-D-glutamate--2,6-diaminopimelate ligase
MEFATLIKPFSSEIISIKGSSSELEISGLEYDSRKIKPGDLFFAVGGYQTDGRKYIDQAVSKGAVAVALEGDSIPQGVTTVRVKNVRRAMALISSEFYGRPSEKMTMLAITGTAGKTTSSYLARSILAAAGRRTGLLGTINYWVLDHNYPAPNTTPESLDLQRLLAEMRENGVDTVVMEASSHGIQLERMAGINFRAAAFTNFSQDHLDFHGSMDEYLKAKLRLFQNLDAKSYCVVNLDDSTSQRVMESTKALLLTFSLEKQAQVMARDIKSDLKGSTFTLVTPEGQVPIILSLPGRPNIYNALTATGLALLCGVNLKSIKTGLESVSSVAGRFELIPSDLGFDVVVDYAHTPEELERALATAKGLASGRLITVFGCGGDRDRTKRPLMGHAVGRYSDEIIVTSDNPRTEDPQAIIEDILPGLEGRHYQIVPERKEAIFRAIGSARKGDLVMIAGKGHEDYQIIGTQKIHFDDREVAGEALHDLGKAEKR